MRREISSGSSASPANRSVAKALPALSDFVVDVPEDMTRLIHLAIPCHFPAGARGRDEDQRGKNEKKFYLIDKKRGKMGPLAASDIQAMYARGILSRSLLLRSNLLSRIRRKFLKMFRSERRWHHGRGFE